MSIDNSADEFEKEKEPKQVIFPSRIILLKLAVLRQIPQRILLSFTVRER